MTLTLALDTATDLASLALGRDGELLAEITLGRQRHAAQLVPAVAQLLDAAGETLEAVERIVIADGPGSFTGLRIGFATVQGLAHGRDDLIVVSAPSLLAAAWTGSRIAGGGAVAALYDALRGEVYGAVYRITDRVETVVSPAVTTVEALAARAAVVLAVGDGAARYDEAVRTWTGRAPVPPPAGAPRGSGLLALADLPGGATPVADLTTFTPTYGRPAEAQARWEETHGRPLPDSPGQPR